MLIKSNFKFGPVGMAISFYIFLCFVVYVLSIILLNSLIGFVQGFKITFSPVKGNFPYQRVLSNICDQILKIEKGDSCLLRIRTHSFT